MIKYARLEPTTFRHLIIGLKTGYGFISLLAQAGIKA